MRRRDGRRGVFCGSFGAGRRVPADLRGFDDPTVGYDRRQTVRALPTYQSDGAGGYTQPGLLFWNDFGRRGGLRMPAAVGPRLRKIAQIGEFCGGSTASAGRFVILPDRRGTPDRPTVGVAVLDQWPWRRPTHPSIIDPCRPTNTSGGSERS